MDLSVGIVGLPNVGKSTLFNAVTRSKAEASNYPFCTIDPNVGIVEVPDERLAVLGKLSKSEKIIPAAIEFVDIAGLIKGASEGEGLGNKFLDNIRRVNAIAQVVRCFEDENIVHVDGSIDPKRDAEIIKLELIYSDLESINKKLIVLEKKIKGNDKEAKILFDLLQKAKKELEQGKLANSILSFEDQELLRIHLPLLSVKPMIYVANVSEKDIANSQNNIHFQKLQAIAKQDNIPVVTISAQIEAELVDLPAKDAQEMLKELGLKESGLNLLAKTCFNLLGLQTFLTTGEKETKAWIIKQGTEAPQAAGTIHGDFEKGFIKAEVVSYADFIKYGSAHKAAEQGVMRLEGREYILRKDDIILFKFNT